MDGATARCALRTIVLGVAVAVLPVAVRAQAPMQMQTQTDQQLSGLADMRTAGSYAAQAAAGQSREEVHAELQRVMNCLEGKRGPDYRQLPEGTPCHEDGAVNEFPDRSLNHLLVQQAIKLGAIAMTLDGFDSLHFTAQAVQAVLIEALNSN